MKHGKATQSLPSPSPRLCQSIARCSPSSMPSVVYCFLFQVVPSFLAVSSCHLLPGRPLDLFPPLGCHSVQRLVHLLSFILAVCPTHFHVCFSVYSMMSVMFVLFLISDHDIYLGALDITYSYLLLFEHFPICLSVVY